MKGRYVNRRDFLKFSAASALSFGASKTQFLTGQGFLKNQLFSNGYRLGRVTRSITIYNQPTFESEELGYFPTDAVVKILAEKLGDRKPVHNPIWLRTEKGWIHSSFVQPVRYALNEPLHDLPATGQLMEVTVPFTQAWRVREEGLKKAYRFYFASTYWVDGISEDRNGSFWYLVRDDLLKENTYVVEAAHMRPVLPEELTPLSPQITDKRIDVDLAKQAVTAFENGKAVYTSRISSGDLMTTTPKGEFLVERKQPTRHMALLRTEVGGYDLPGVPWVCFISWTGVSLHGTYWHNNFGEPQSHGCINLTPEAAKWMYRWTLPVVPHDEDFIASDTGTRVLVL